MKPLATIVSVALALTLAATITPAAGQTPGGGWESVAQAAKKEGSLTFYSTENPAVNDKLVKSFSAKYGIRVDVLRLATSDLLQRYSSEAQAGAVVADVLLIADPRIFTNNPQWWKPIDVTLLPELNNYPKESRESSYVRLYGHPLGITYNSAKIAPDKAPRGFQDLTRPEFRGRILLTDPRSSSSWIGLADFWDRTLGEQFLKALAAQKPALVESAATGAQQVAAGAYDINVGSTPAHPAPLIAKGAKLVFVTPESTVIASQVLGVSAKAPNPNAARLFASWMLTREAAEISCAGITVSYRPDAEGCRKMPPKFEQVNLRIADSARLFRALGLAR